MTKLYEIFILNSIKRHANIIGSDHSSIRKLNTFEKLPEPLQQQLSALSKLAYDGLVAEEIVFTIDDFHAAFPDCRDLDIERNLLGLMTAFKGFTSTGEELSYQFLHLLIQEFLAAKWAASQLSGGELLNLFQDNLREELYSMELLFLAGISHLNFPSVEDLFQSKLVVQYHDTHSFIHFLFLSHLIYESHNFSLFHNLGSSIVGAELFAARYRMSPFDCLVLAHFLTWCDCSLKLLDLSNCGLTSQSLEIMHRVNLEHCGTIQIEEVNLSYNPKIITKLSLLSKLPMFEHTKVLRACGLQYPEGVSCNQVEFHSLMNLEHLTILDISVRDISCSDSGIYPSSYEFEHTVKKMLSMNRILVLKLSGFGLTCEVAACFADGLAQNSSLKNLILSSNKIGSAGAVNIFRSVEHNTSLEELDVSENSQLAEDNSEAVGCAIERMLNVNKTLKVFNLSGCELPDPIVKCILTGLTKNTSLAALYMWSPKLSGSCAVSLFQHMTTHPTLNISVGEVNVLGVGKVKMDRESVWCVIGDTIPDNCVEFFRALNNSGLKVSKLNVQDLTDQTAKHFAVGLAEVQSVEALKLSHSFWKEKNISSAGAVSIFRSLEYNTTLEELDVSENSQLAEGDSEAVGCAIERMLNVNKTLKVLNLSGCELPDPIVKCILTGRTKNTSLVKLDIRSPKLSGSCAVSLFEQITTHPTLNITVGEVNVLGVGKVKIDRESVWCVIGDTIPENCVEFFRALNNSGLKVSKLSVQNLTDQTAEQFAVGLAEIQSVQALKLINSYLGKKNISSAGAVSIVRSLEHNTSLEELDLSENIQLAEDDSEAVGCAIERMLNVNRTLKVLNLSGCGFATAQNCMVQKVALCLNQTGRTGAVNIFRSLENNGSLKELDLSGNQQLAEGDSEAVGCAIERMLNVNRTLKVLNLSGCELSDPIVKCILTGLTKNTSLVKLDIRSPKLSGSCAVSLFEQITTHPTLNITVGEVNVLGVGKVKIDRESVWCIIGDMIPENCVEFFRALNNSGLKVSKLSVQNLTDQTAEQFAVGLAEIQSVQALKLINSYLGKKNISSAGAVSIVRSLEHNTSLEELDLSENIQLAEDDSEAVGCAIERMLNVNRTLKVLDLSGCGFANEVATYFSNGLAQNCMVQNVALCLNQTCSTGAVNIFRSLENNGSLKELDLSGNQQLAEGDSEAVVCAIERMLNVNRTLKVLNLSGCELPDPIVKCILTGLTKNTSLVKLDIRSPKLSGSCAVSLFEQITTHPTLNITVGEVNVLGVGKVKIDRESVWCIIGDMIPENCVEFFRALNNSGLKVSKLSVQNLTDQTAEQFAVGLAEIQSVQALKLINSYLGKKSISSAGAVSIVRSLEHNTSLEELDLSENIQLAEDDSEAVGCAIERMLNVNRTLKVLNLSGCGFANEVATYFSNGLAQNCMVQKVALCLNQTGSTGAVNIFRSLENNGSLKELDLSGNQQLAEGDSEGVGCAIERMLNVNRTLKVLNLSGCRLGTSVATHIAAGLAQNASLAELHFGRYSGIASEGWVHVFKALCKNTSLKKLHISSSNVRFGVSVALANMLSCNKSMIELSLWWCHIPKAGLREIARGLLQNTSLQIVWIGNTQHKTFLEAEIMTGELQSSRKLEIK